LLRQDEKVVGWLPLASHYAVTHAEMLRQPQLHSYWRATLKAATPPHSAIAAIAMPPPLRHYVIESRHVAAADDIRH